MDELLSMGEPPDKDNDHEEEKAAAGDPDAGDSTSFNPLANLQKQYDEMLAMASMVQLKLAEAAGTRPAHNHPLPRTVILSWTNGARYARSGPSPISVSHDIPNSCALEPTPIPACSLSLCLSLSAPLTSLDHPHSPPRCAEMTAPPNVDTKCTVSDTNS
jgi:hypothetical protein